MRKRELANIAPFAPISDAFAWRDARAIEPPPPPPGLSGPKTAPDPPQKSVVMRYIVAAWFVAINCPLET